MNPLILDDTAWTPSACTLPTEDRPLRLAEFDELFSQHVAAVTWREPGRLLLELRPDHEVAARAASLAARETQCCSFFRFDLAISEGVLALEVSTPQAHTDVLTALGDRADALVARTAS